MRRLYNDKDRAEIYRLKTECGMTCPQLAERYGVSAKSIANQLRVHRESLRKRGEQVAYCMAGPIGRRAGGVVAAPKKYKRPEQLGAKSSASTNVNIRIAEQGITAGVFGDPPAGRSALDARGGRT